MIAEKLNREDYNIKEKFMTVKKINLRLFAVMPALYALYVFIYILRWGGENVFSVFFRDMFFLVELMILALGVFAFLAFAMIIKAVFMSYFSENKSESLRFKIIKEIQKPHCCLKEPIAVRQYKICLIVYILIVGVAPYIVSFMLGNFMVVLASFICAFFAGTDILFLLSLLREDKNSYVLDFDGIMLYRIYEKT